MKNKCEVTGELSPTAAVPLNLLLVLYIKKTADLPSRYTINMLEKLFPANTIYRQINRVIKERCCNKVVV